MIEVLDTSYPVARKEHRCCYCGGVIAKGEKYECQTNKCDGELYRWKSHLHCSKVACEIEDYDDYGISDGDFRDWIDEYVYENHYDERIDDISEDWQNKSYKELADMIYEEISKEIIWKKKRIGTKEDIR